MIEILLLFREALLGAVLIALGCSVVGVFVVYRRIVFVSAALAQLSSAGVATALWLVAWGWGPGLFGTPLFMSSAFTLVGVLFFSMEGGRHTIPGDARLGIAYVLAGAAAVLLIAHSAGGDAHELMLRGNILGLGAEEVVLLLGVLAAVLGLHFLFHKEFLFVSYDAEMASTLGYRVRIWNLLLYLTLGAMITVSIRSAGVLLVFALLILPPVTGILMGRTLGAVLVWSGISAVAAALLGFILSIRFDLPSGPAIVATCGAFVALAWALSALRRYRWR